ncbi:MAG TPA: VCBS repeat-containing protein [Puia sp.]|nr:VCBS repeat-containing protein [Puia sp.]
MPIKRQYFLWLMTGILLLPSCERKDTLFTRMDMGNTHVDFRNVILDNNERFSCLNFPYYYNGGGVAVGDFNNDGLPDLVFTGSMVKNRLYLNKGNFQFQDITLKSGIAQFNGWCTGVAVADVNGDGWQDIYICRSALEDGKDRTNLLFINNGPAADGGPVSFTESAARYGLNDSGYSTQASFFDYDKDGDLDLFLIKQSKPEYARGINLNYAGLKRQAAEPAFENKLYRNDGGHFTDVTHQAGINSNPLSFSLGVVTADVNMDGWPDIYVSNDYNEEDYLYINNKDGTFTDRLREKLDHVALYSMGCDIADYNNDGLPDICTLDMLPGKYYDLKMHSAADRFDKYQQLLSYGFYPFYMRNQLQKNNGDGSFSEIAQLTGMDATDWSWSVLFADYDLDGLKDAYITNGVKRDITNLDFLQFAQEHAQAMRQGGAPMSFQEYLTHIPGEIGPHYFFRNKGGDRFENDAAGTGLGETLISNGAVYVDLDNDGDLDLVTNNIDDYACIYRNNAETLYPDRHFIKFLFKGDRGNPSGIGSKVFVYSKGQVLYQEQLLTRGFQSGVDPAMSVGLGVAKEVDSVLVIWPDDKYQVLKSVKTGQTDTLQQSAAAGRFDYGRLSPSAARTLFTEVAEAIPYTHKEAYRDDFLTQSLMPHFYSHDGPCMATADLNGDGLTDLFIGGSKGGAGKIFFAGRDGKFVAAPDAFFKGDENCKDAGAVFFDADGDGDMDLYVVSGGYELEKNSPAFRDRLYINDGKGLHEKKGAVPALLQNKSCVAVYDINQDGHPDLFVGGSVSPGNYPLSTPSRILMNDGKGVFTDRTAEVCPELLSQNGIVHAAVWVDVNKDDKKDLVIAGEWMPVKIFLNNGMTLTRAEGLGQTLPSGWWFSLTVADMDGDGNEDIVAGNYGLNSPLRASVEQPMEIHFSDIDQNGIIDPFISIYQEGIAYPLAGMDDAIRQVPMLRKNYYNHVAFARAGIGDLYRDKNLKDVPGMSVTSLETVCLRNTGHGFSVDSLPVEAQYGPVYVSCVEDFNHDGYKDILLLGNNKYNKLRIGQLDANHGILLAGAGGGQFHYVPQNVSGLKIREDVRSAVCINGSLVVGVNNGAPKVYRTVGVSKADSTTR